MRITTGNHGFLRQQNLSGVINLLYENAPVSRAELARLTGLNKATISSLIGELIENRFVREIGESTDKRAGRREVLLDLDPRHGCIISAEIGVGFISLICTDFTADIVWRHREKTREVEPVKVLGETIKLIRRARSTGERKCGPLLGVAVGMPGLIDQKSGTLLFAPNLGWSNVDVLKTLTDSIAVPVFIGNEATFAALGEKYFGVARGANDVLYVSAGIGIGGGLIIGGQLYNGAAGVASEFGHMTMEPGGRKCACGNFGCWETLASQTSLFRLVGDAIAAGAQSILSTFGGLTVGNIVEAAEKGDAVALDALNITGTHLGVGMDALVKTLNPE
ncbi:MAG: ROK family transcriptional regulator, partial [Acidobacteriota bacterium]